MHVRKMWGRLMVAFTTALAVLGMMFFAPAANAAPKPRGADDWRIQLGADDWRIQLGADDWRAKLGADDW